MGNGSHLATAVLVTLSLLASPVSGQVIWPDRTYELSPEDRNRLDALRRSQNEADAKESAEMKAFREKLLRSPPLPDERNVLLGRWRVEGATRPKNENEQFMALFTNPGAGCEMLFGSGVTEFAPTTFSTSGLAGLARGPIAYRSAGRQVIAAIPANSTKVWAFEVANPNRIVAGDNCTLVRVGSAAPAAQGGPPNRAPAPSNAGAPPPTAASTAGVVDGAAFRCSDGSILQVSLCEGSSPDATCKLTRADVPLAIGTMLTGSAIATRVNGCEAGGIRYGADHKAVFVR